MAGEWPSNYHTQTTASISGNDLLINSKILVDYGVQNNNNNNNNNNNINDDDDDNDVFNGPVAIMYACTTHIVSFVSLAWASSETHNLLNTKKIKPLAHKMTVVLPGIHGGNCGNLE